MTEAPQATLNSLLLLRIPGSLPSGRCNTYHGHASTLAQQIVKQQGGHVRIHSVLYLWVGGEPFRPVLDGIPTDGTLAEGDLKVASRSREGFFLSAIVFDVREA